MKTRSHRLRLTGAALMLALVATATPALTTVSTAIARDQGAPRSLLTGVSADEAGADLSATPRATRRGRLVAIDGAALAASNVGDRLSIDLFDDASVTAVIDERTQSDGATTWVGHLDGQRGTFIGVEVDGFHNLSVSTATGMYEVAVAQQGAHEKTSTAIYRVTEPAMPRGVSGNDAVLPPQGASDPNQGSAKSRRGGSTPTTPSRRDGAEQIDVAIVYPAATVTQSGEAALQALITQAFAQTNQAFADSGLTTRVRFVGSQQLAAATTTDMSAMIKALANPQDGLFDEAHVLREQTHADLVSLWLPGDPGNASCGLGSLGGYNPRSESESAAWTVIYAQNCAVTRYTFAHELGHNLSAHHDAGAAQPPTGGKPYARGYVDIPAKTVTIMSYYDQCIAAQVYCTKIGYFSNPNVSTSAGRITGTPEANNAQAIAEQGPVVANYRLEKIYPGTVAITGSARSGGTLTANVTGWGPANVAFTYQWLVDGVAQPGVTGATFTPAAEHIGRVVSVQVTGSAPYYSPVPLASEGVAIGNALFRTSKPKLSGKARAGAVLRVKVKGWSPSPKSKSVKARYTWYRNGKKIKGAKGTRYRVKRKDRGKKISVRLTTSAAGYDTAARSSRKIRIRR